MSRQSPLSVVRSDDHGYKERFLTAVTETVTVTVHCPRGN